MAHRKAWPAATAVLAQVATTGKVKNRYIDILIPRYFQNYTVFINAKLVIIRHKKYDNLSIAKTFHIFLCKTAISYET